MGLRRIVIACVMLAAFAMVSQAEAGVPIPCAGSHVYQIRDPEVMMGQATALYYSVGCWGGNWHQYRTPDGRYLYFSQDALAKLPQPPGFWASFWAHKLDFWVEWFWVVLMTMAVLLGALCKATGVDPNDLAEPSVRDRTHGLTRDPEVVATRGAAARTAPSARPPFGTRKKVAAGRLD